MASEAANRLISQHCVFRNVGVRMGVHDSPGADGASRYVLRLRFIARTGNGRYGSFAEAPAIEIQPDDLVRLVKTLTGESGEFTAELKRRGEYKKLRLVYQPAHSAGPFWLAATLDTDRKGRFEGHTTLGEHDAMQLLWMATRVAAQSMDCPLVDALTLIQRVGARSPGRWRDQEAADVG